MKLKPPDWRDVLMAQRTQFPDKTMDDIRREFGWRDFHSEKETLARYAEVKSLLAMLPLDRQARLRYLKDKYGHGYIADLQMIKEAVTNGEKTHNRHLNGED
jgi:signal recognition particle GTPase